ncbi:MAG: hypothetical protein JNM59_11840 [Hyphomonadaceae bacterium]|nr:hypothetical protein [Hyphomonadaceae bacterium]
MRMLLASLLCAAALVVPASAQINVPTPPEIHEREGRRVPGYPPIQTPVYGDPAHWIGEWRADGPARESGGGRGRTRYVSVESFSVRPRGVPSITSESADYLVTVRYRIVEPGAAPGPLQTQGGTGVKDRDVFVVRVYGEPRVISGVPRCGFYLMLRQQATPTSPHAGTIGVFPAVRPTALPWRCGPWESLSPSSTTLRRLN